MDGVRNLLDLCSDDSMDVFVALDLDRQPWLSFTITAFICTYWPLQNGKILYALLSQCRCEVFARCVESYLHYSRF
jgi:hypothetical protein